MARPIRYSIVLILSVVGLGLVVLTKKPISELLISDHMSEFVDAVDRHRAKPANKLILIDLDDTAFHSVKLVGTPTWYYNMLNIIRQSGVAKNEAFLVMNKIDELVQERTQVALIELATARAIATWQKQNTVVIGLSSRLKNMKDITERQLESVGLQFWSPYFACMEKLWPKDRGEFAHGVIYVDDFANKGKILNNALDLLIACGMHLELVAQADDQQHYVTEVSKLVRSRNLDFIGIIYGGVFRARAFDLHEANQQLFDMEETANMQIIPDEYRKIFMDH